MSKDWKHDIAKAREYWARSAVLGNEEAQSSLERIYPKEQKNIN